ncbi:MAG TPA: hypothetical protein VFV38_41325 [Ktedonobacteraceae bacterium]|nr:hypothetical protein [Ktedonobacteraceae bacterium]
MVSMDEQTQTVSGVRLATFRRCFAQIVAGDDPWLALGNMMHQFFGRYQDFRAELVREAIEVPMDVTAEQWRWAVWCAASVEYLCKKYGLAVPVWSLDEQYRLVEPWYYDEVSGAEEEAELREETPEEFARRGIFCEHEPYRNKYEYKGRMTA